MADTREEIKLKILAALKRNNITSLEDLAADAAERCQAKYGASAAPGTFYVNQTFHMEADED